MNSIYRYLQRYVGSFLSFVTMQEEESKNPRSKIHRYKNRYNYRHVSCKYSPEAILTDVI